MLNIAVSYLRYGSAGFLLLFSVLSAIYFSWKLCIFLAEGFFGSDKQALRSARRLFDALFRIVAFVLVLFTVFGLAIEHVDTRAVPHEYIAAVNLALMRADHFLFGVYPPLWLQSSGTALKPFFDTIAPLVVGVYHSIAVILSLGFLCVLIARPKLFLEMFAAFILCMLIGVPFWYFFPALSPIEAYYMPLLNIPVPKDILSILSHYEPNRYVLEYIMEDAAYVHRIKESHMLVTTMPSMHAAWIAMTAYYLTAAWRPFVLIGVPYVLLNAFSTLYVMQHYAVDQIAGFLVAMLAILIARKMHLTPGRHLAFVLKVIGDDVRKLKREAKTFLG
jgi:membrane-associated phospholipid phosphatase